MPVIRNFLSYALNCVQRFHNSNCVFKSFKELKRAVLNCIENKENLRTIKLKNFLTPNLNQLSWKKENSVENRIKAYLFILNLISIYFTILTSLLTCSCIVVSIYREKRSKSKESTLNLFESFQQSISSEETTLNSLKGTTVQSSILNSSEIAWNSVKNPFPWNLNVQGFWNYFSLLIQFLIDFLSKNRHQFLEYPENPQGIRYRQPKQKLLYSTSTLTERTVLTPLKLTASPGLSIFLNILNLNLKNNPKIEINSRKDSFLRELPNKRQD